MEIIHENSPPLREGKLRAPTYPTKNAILVKTVCSLVSRKTKAYRIEFNISIIGNDFDVARNYFKVKGP